MRDVADEGMRVARHLRGEIYEVRADAAAVSYRVLFASLGTKGRILLSLIAFRKQTQRTPRPTIEFADAVWPIGRRADEGEGAYHKWYLIIDMKVGE